MRRVLVLALIALPSTTTVAAVAKRVPKAEQTCEIIDHGHYRATTARVTLPDEGSPTGDRFETEEVEFTDRTKTIARELDKSFGIRYRVHVPPNKSTKITWRISYPRALKGKRAWNFSEEWTSTTGELVQHIGYTFVEAWEMVPGDWKMQVLVEDQPACSFTFTVK